MTFLAEGVVDMSTITTAMVTAITSVASNAMTGISDRAGAAPVFGGLVLIGVAMLPNLQVNRIFHTFGFGADFPLRFF